MLFRPACGCDVMDVLLVSPKSGVWTSPELLPAGLAYLAAALEQAGHSVRVHDAVTEDTSVEAEMDAAATRGHPYGMVGITAVTPLINEVWRVAAEAKRRGAVTVLGGPHPTILPEESLGRPEVMVPSGVLLVYMVLIGIIGRLKDEGGTRFTLLVSGGGLAVTLVAAAVFYWYRAGSTFAVAMLMMVAASLAVPALYAVLHLSPRAIARLVAVGILAAALMDASFIFGASKGEGLRLSEGLWGLFTIALICPAALFMRMLPPPEPPPELPASPFAGGVRAGSL